MRLLTDEQHAQIVEALSDERYVSQYSHIKEALATLTAAPSLEQVGWCHNDGDDSLISCLDKEVNTVQFSERYLSEHSIALYAIKKETP